MYIRIPLWIKVMRALQVRSHNTYTISQEFKCNKNTASIVLNRLVRTGYAKRDEYNWFSAAKIQIKCLADSIATNVNRAQRIDSDQTNRNRSKRMSIDPNNRSHMVQLNEHQILILSVGLELYARGQNTAVIKDEAIRMQKMFKDLIELPETEYDHNMLHGFTL